MFLVILPTRLAETLGKDGGIVDTQQEVLDLIKEAIGSEREFDDFSDADAEAFKDYFMNNYGSSGYIKKFTANKSSWTVNNGEYLPTDSLTRYFFISAEYEPSQGNFLDAVSFGQNLPIPSENELNLEIKKTVRGLEVPSIADLADRLSNLQFTVNVKDSNNKVVLEKTVTGNADDSNKINWTFTDEPGVYARSYNIPNIPLAGSEPPYTITVTESGGELNGYELTVTSSNTVTGQKALNASTGEKVQTVSGVNIGKLVTVSFTNAYTEKEEPPQPAVNWKMIKCSSSTGANEPKLPLSEAEFTASAVRQDSDGKEISVIVAKGTSGTGGEITWKVVGTDGKETAEEWKPQSGTYTITETKAPAGYSLMGSLQVTFTDGTPAFVENENVEKKDNTEGDTTVTFYLKNTPVYSLPSTGGSGIYWYMFSGVLLIAGATLFLYKNKVQGGAGKSD